MTVNKFFVHLSVYVYFCPFTILLILTLTKWQDKLNEPNVFKDRVLFTLLNASTRN